MSKINTGAASRRPLIVVAVVVLVFFAIVVALGVVSFQFGDQSDDSQSGSLCEYVHGHIGEDYSHASPSQIIVDPDLGQGTEDEFTDAELYAIAYTLADDQIVPDELLSDWVLFVSELQQVIDDPQLTPSNDARLAAGRIEEYLDKCEP